jgi:hypothetical protein
MLHLHTVDAHTLGLLKSIQAQPEFSETRLVGGTALALQLGHRKSIDLDFFGMWDTSLDLGEVLSRCGSVHVEHTTKIVRTYFVESVKVDIVYYQYQWLKPLILEENIRFASTSDIAAMKLEAVNNRGSKKDFMDVAFLLEHFSLREIMRLYREKYPDSNEYMILRSLVYFDDAELEPMPMMLRPLTWEAAKERICDAVRATA